MKKPVQVFNFSVFNAASDEVDIHIDGQIVDASTQSVIKAWFGDETSVSYKSFRDEINNKYSHARIYNVIINSPGGHVGDALAIHDYLTALWQKSGKIVNTIGRGIVASSATLILLSGEKPRMSANSWFMMHTVSGGIYGTVDQVENYGKTMRKFNNLIRDLYASKSGMRSEEVTKLMDAETWLTAAESKDKGFVAEIEGEAEFQNCLNGEEYDFVPQNILNQYNQSVKSPGMKNIFAPIMDKIRNALKGIKAPDPVVQNSHETFMTEVGNAISESFKDFDLTPIVNQAIQAALPGEIAKLLKPIEDRVKPLEDRLKPVEDRLKPVEDKIKPLEDKVAQLEQDIITNTGKPSNGGDGGGGEKVIGGFTDN